MNYLTVNKAILDGETSSLKKDEALYNYLLLNNVAYYFSSTLVERREFWDRAVIEAGDKFNTQFIKTLVLIDKICRKKKISYALYKTYKLLPEAVDGDIDLFVKEKDFDLFMSAFEDEGFVCQQTEHLKGQCIKEGFCKVEPRTSMSFHGITVLSEKELWKNTLTVKVRDLTVLTASRELDVLGLLLNILFGPNYCKLYLLKVLQRTDRKKLKFLVGGKMIYEDLLLLLSWLDNKNILKKRFPVFINSGTYLVWWFRKIWTNPDLGAYDRFKHLAFFFYSKYGYALFNRLPFTHDWKLKI